MVRLRDSLGHELLLTSKHPVITTKGAMPADVRSRLGAPPGCPILVYHGIYSYPPNLESIEFLAREILPRLHGRGVVPKVMAVGPKPPSRSPHPDIVFTGPVPEVAPYLLAADVAIVPLQRGGGTRMKVLDYFAARLPVVTTTKGVEGLPVTDGEHVLVRDDPDAFAAAVVEVLASPSRRSALGAAGRQLVETLDWSRIAERYLVELRARE
jgi:glycosyltransferase involved in cell wall biosynthesis